MAQARLVSISAMFAHILPFSRVFLNKGHNFHVELKKSEAAVEIRLDTNG
jgi:hypothetical protein